MRCEGRLIFTRKMAELNSYWEHLAKTIEPVMQIGELLVEDVRLLAEEFGVDMDSVMKPEDVPTNLRERLRERIVAEMDGILEIPMLGELLKSGDLYQSMFEQLEVEHGRLDKRDVSARAFVQELMQEVMNVSIETGKMRLADWDGIIERRKAASRVEDVAEYVYKKFCVTLRESQEASVYDFFYNKSSPDEIDRLLGEARESLMLASSHRGMTKKRGQGMSRFIIDYIRQWQEQGLMKPMKSVFPFCQCLQQHWNDEINLGTRQGLEATYKLRL